MPDSNVPCPEPMPYSNESQGYADIDFTPASHSVFDNKAQLVPVDKILSNQLGDVTKPGGDFKPLPEIVGSPILPSTGEDNAKPLLSSYAGADISLPTTLGGTDVNSVSVNDIVNPGSQPAQANQPKPEPIAIKPVPMAPMNAPVPSKPMENFSNNVAYGPENNLANYISKTNPIGRVEKFGPPEPKVEHFGGKKEHFANVQTMDNIVFGVVVVALGYYYVSTYHPEYLSNMDVSKVPIVSQLNDPNVSNENKIIIVVAVVVGLVLVSRMLK